MNKSLKTYQTMDTIGKSQIELVLQVYNGAIKTYGQAADLIREEKYNDLRDTLEKAKRFIVHLYTTLDVEKGGEIAANLGKLYSYVICQTMVLEATKDLAIIDDILTVLKNLREGWQGLSEQGKAAKAEQIKAVPESEMALTGSFTTSA